MKELFKHIKRLVGGVCIVGILMAIGAGLYELWAWLSTFQEFWLFLAGVTIVALLIGCYYIGKFIENI